MPTNNHAKPVHAFAPEAVADRFDVDPEQGLDSSEAADRLKEHGPNELETVGGRSPWSILLDQFKSVVIIVLVVAAIPAVLTARWPEAIAIAAVVLVNTLLGFFSEWKASQTIEALRAEEEAEAKVRRGGKDESVPVRDLVPGDIVRFSEGSLIPADLRILKAERVRANEAALTGESVPVDKTNKPVDEETTLAERSGMLYKGTSIAQGSGLGIVAATGMDTELGKIARQAQEAESAEEPLRQRLDRLGKNLAIVVVITAVVVAGLGLLAGRETLRMLETAIALGVAAIPEGLPIVATLALARGMYLMGKRNAVVKRLNAVQSLGSTPIIFVDKTGTVTENRMSVRHLLADGAEETMEEGENGNEELPDALHRVLEIGVLCNGAALEEDGEERGDPLETALLRAGRRFGLKRDQLLEDQPEERLVDFDPEVMMMATFHGGGDDLRVAVKGAPEAVLEASTRLRTKEGEEDFSDQDRQRWTDRAEELAGEGLRLLGFAEKSVSDTDANPYESLTFVGLVGMMDPPRDDVRDAVDACEDAGLRVVMVTGDKPATAEAIARQAGLGHEDKELTVIHGRDLTKWEELDDSHRKRLLEADVFARVQPEQKLRLVEFYQNEGLPSAMTGDGVNDAPALKKANIGVAMGQRGTDAAKQTADIVLRDDAFSTIVAAVRQGRIIFTNIRQSAMFMVTTNFAEVLAVAIGSLLPAPLPLIALQILFLNVLTDVFPALALGVGPGHGGVMKEPPRDPSEGILTRRNWIELAIWGVIVGLLVLGALWIALTVLDLDGAAATTISFLTLAFAKLWFPFNLRHSKSGFLRNEVVRNPWIWGSIAICVPLLLAAIYLPGLNTVLQTVPPSLEGWGVILGLSLVPVLLGQLRFALGIGGSTESKTR